MKRGSRKSKSDGPNGTDYVRRAKKLGFDRDRIFESMLEFKLLDPSDGDLDEMMTEKFEEAELANLVNPDPFRATAPLLSDDLDGELIIGRTVNGGIFGLNRDELCRHLLLIGASGTGKTQIQLMLAAQLVSGQSQTSSIFLAEKRNLRALMRLSDHVTVVPWLFLRDNILRNPPHVTLKAWKNVMPQLLAGAGFYMLLPSRALLLELVDELYADFAFTGETDQSCPNISHLHDKIRSKRYNALSHPERYRENLENRVGAVRRHCGEIFDCDYGIDLGKLLKKNVVIELDGLAREMKELVITLLLTRIFMYRIALGERTTLLKTLVLVDEGQDVFRRQAELQEAPSVLATLIAQAREFGCGLCVGAQQIRDLSYSLTSNTAHKIGTGFADLRDLDEFCRIV